MKMRNLINVLAGVFAAAIELSGLWRVERPGDLLGFAESSGCLGIGRDSEQQAAHSNKTGTH